MPALGLNADAEADNDDGIGTAAWPSWGVLATAASACPDPDPALTYAE